jgi:4-hydroxy-2-oxoglutarate aldolase
VDLSGIYPALTTPFAHDGSVSLADFKHNIHKYNGTDLAGYVVAGSTGESVLLSREEWDGILATVKEAASREKKLIAGCGMEGTAETVERCKRAADLGYHVALVKTPHYYKPLYKPEALMAHYRRVADASPIPVLLYSVPIFTGVTLESPEVIALSEHSNIIGIKDSSGDIRRAAEIITGTSPRFQVFLGGAPTIFPCLPLGIRGGILALASALPEKCAALYQLFRLGQLEKARELHELIVRCSRVIVSEMGLPGVKYVMDHRGYRGGVPRLPILPLHDAQKKRLTELLGSIEPAAVRV